MLSCQTGVNNPQRGTLLAAVFLHISVLSQVKLAWESLYQLSLYSTDLPFISVMLHK